MLVEFRVKNFRSFRDEQTLSLVASTDKSLPDNCIATPKLKLLRSAGVYGPNASGKSNLIKAVTFMQRTVLDSAKKQAEIIIPRDDDDFTYQLHCSPILRGLDKIIGQVITLHDITEQVKLYKQVEKLSITDPLTSAFNRRALALYGEQEIQRSHRYQRKLSLILLDVDNFKDINDRYGHQGGDYALKTIVQSIRNRIRDNDFIFRYGGDEFVVLLIETGIPEAIETAKRIRYGLAHLPAGDEHTTPQKVLVSLGITGLSPDDNLESLLQHADQALYQAKAAGKDQAVLA